MRAVVDANVFVSALIVRDSTPFGVIVAWDRGLFTLVSSPALTAELRDVLARPRIARRIVSAHGVADILLSDIEERAVTVRPDAAIHVCRDPADNRVLEAAVAGEAEYIVSGDRDLLALGAYDEIEVVSPARFLAVVTLREALDL